MNPLIPVEHTLLVVFTVSPINENYGLCAPITPAMTLPKWIPIFSTNSSFYPNFIVLAISIILIAAYSILKVELV